MGPCVQCSDLAQCNGYASTNGFDARTARACSNGFCVECVNDAQCVGSRHGHCTFELDR